MKVTANITEEDEVENEKNKKKKPVIKLQNCIDTSDVTNSIDGDFKLYNAQNQKTKK